MATRVDLPLVVIDGDVTLPHYLEPVSAHYDRGVLVDTDSQKLGVRLDDLDEIELSW